MTNNDKDAISLSTEEKIKNPYFGEVTLKCGNIK